MKRLRPYKFDLLTMTDSDDQYSQRDVELCFTVKQGQKLEDRPNHQCL